MGEGTTQVAIASLSNIASGIGSVSTWFWGIFTDFVDMIAKNDLLLWMVILLLLQVLSDLP